MAERRGKRKEVHEEVPETTEGHSEGQNTESAPNEEWLNRNQTEKDWKTDQEKEILEHGRKLEKRRHREQLQVRKAKLEAELQGVNEDLSDYDGQDLDD